MRQLPFEDLFGPRCNAEFRGDFAAHLRQAMRPEQLQEAWLFLVARRRERDAYSTNYARLVRFLDDRRAPPIRWTFANSWLQAETAQALRRSNWGPALGNAMTQFWDAQAVRVRDDGLACPRAHAEWQPVRDRLRAEMDRR